MKLRPRFVSWCIVLQKDVFCFNKRGRFLVIPGVITSFGLPDRPASIVLVRTSLNSPIHFLTTGSRLSRL